MKKRMAWSLIVCAMLFSLCSCKTETALPEPTSAQKMIVASATLGILTVEKSYAQSGSYAGFSVTGNTETFLNCQCTIDLKGSSIVLTLNGTVEKSTGSDFVRTVNLSSISIPLYGKHSVQTAFSTNVVYTSVSIDGMALNPASFNGN